MATIQRIFSFIARTLIRLLRFWGRDIQRRQGCKGKAISIGIGLLLLLFACSVPIVILQEAGEAAGLLPTRTATPSPTATLKPTATFAQAPTATIEPTRTPKPISAEEPTNVPTSTNAPKPTKAVQLTVSIATAAPLPTATTAGSSGHTFSGDVVDPPWWPCQQGQIKGNLNSMIYHVPGGQSYAKTYQDVQCFNTEAEAQAAGFRRAKR